MTASRERLVDVIYEACPPIPRRVAEVAADAVLESSWLAAYVRDRMTATTAHIPPAPERAETRGGL